MAKGDLGFNATLYKPFECVRRLPSMPSPSTDTFDLNVTIVPGASLPSKGVEPFVRSSTEKTDGIAVAHAPLHSLKSESNPLDKHLLLAKRLHRSPHMLLWRKYLADHKAEFAKSNHEIAAWNLDARLLHQLISLGYANRTWTPKLETQVHAAVASILPLLRSLAELSKLEKSDGKYTETVMLYSMMPLYINVDQTQIAVGTDQAFELLYEAMILISLDSCVGYELVELLCDEKQYLSPPCDALKSSFNYNLGDISKFLETIAAGEASNKPSAAPVTMPHRSGYWSLALQWMRGTNHITIPPELAVGHVAWHLAKDHWNSLLAELHRNVAPQPKVAVTTSVNASQSIETNHLSPPCKPLLGNLAKSAIETELSENCKSNPEQCPSRANTAVESRSVVENKLADAFSTSGGCHKQIGPASHATLSNNHQDNLKNGMPLNESSSGAVKSLSLSDSATPNSCSQAEIIELRSANDPQLATRLDAQLIRCRDTQGSLALAVVKQVKSSEKHSGSQGIHPGLLDWQSYLIDELTEATDNRLARGFVTGNGELALIVEDTDRNELTQIIREAVDKMTRVAALTVDMIERPSIALASGIACVTSPSKSFKIDQLVQAAWRCLTAAESQGAGAVKSIEVY